MACRWCYLRVGRRAEHRVLEAHLRGALDARLNGRARGRVCGVAEDRAEEISDVDARHFGVVHPNARRSGTLGSAGAPGNAAELVILSSQRRMTENSVGRGGCLEAVLSGSLSGTRARVGMELAGESTKRFGDVLARGVLGDPEHLVVVVLEPFGLCDHESSVS
jgi:hypothetical protein